MKYIFIIAIFVISFLGCYEIQPGYTSDYAVIYHQIIDKNFDGTNYTFTIYNHKGELEIIIVTEGEYNNYDVFQIYH